MTVALSGLSDLIHPEINPDEFRDALVIINNQVTDTPTTEFDGDKNGVSNGDSYGTFAPHPDQKSDLFDLAVNLGSEANENPALQAMRLGVAVLVIHPFIDGNGRTSRFVHASLAGKTTEEISALKIARVHDATDSDALARKIIDLAPPPQLQRYIEHMVYELAEFKPVSHLTTVDDSPEAREIYDDIKSRLSEGEQIDLQTAYKINTQPAANPILRDMGSLDYALTKLGNGGQEKVVTKEKTLSTGETRLIVDVPRTLALLGTSSLQAFLGDVWEYRNLSSEVKIRCVSADRIGSRVISIGHDQPRSIADHYISFTNNLIS